MVRVGGSEGHPKNMPQKHETAVLYTSGLCQRAAAASDLHRPTSSGIAATSSGSGSGGGGGGSSGGGSDDSVGGSSGSRSDDSVGGSSSGGSAAAERPAAAA